MRRSNFLHALQFLNPALGLPRFRGLGAEPADEVFDVCDALLLLLKAHLLLRKLFSPLPLKGGIVASVIIEFVALDTDSAINDVVEEIPVVGDDDQGSGITLQPLFQPQGRI